MKPLSSTIKSTTLIETLLPIETKCVKGNKCETDTDCNGGKCANLFGLIGKFCMCYKKVSFLATFSLCCKLNHQKF